MGLSHKLATNRQFDTDAQAYSFLLSVMHRSYAVSWLGAFRVVLDPQLPVRVDEAGVANAARRAVELRAAGLDTREPEIQAPHEAGEEAVEVG
jgi:hypothetical protein